ncbi:hypothetical protein M0802_016456 [Mischocyttarus mexicanus]|nr:hypothetical protein M0802_016456 [Mischocyttarus mexicanus]
MLMEGKFPTFWKRGTIQVFLKDVNKDPTNARSYRPVTLLPVLGKIVERVLVDILETDLRGKNMLCKDQYGYRKGVGTIDALMEMRRRIEDMKEKYIVGIFMDISGAFDGAWWPKIVEKLRKFYSPRNITNIIRDYFRGRKVVLRIENIEKERILERGCPQGKIGYADDGLVLVGGKSRVEIEERCEKAMEVVLGWMKENKLELSKEKTVLMLLKGNVDDERQARVMVRGETMRNVRTVKYLGVKIDRGMRYYSHAKYLAEKTARIHNQIKRVTKANGEDIGKKAIRTKIMSMQRKALVEVICGYATISHEATRVLAGVIPIDLYSKAKAKI